ncbi:MAG: TonB-dependent receptor family protein [Bacteroidales bacterium]|nr:TonB-dependent receptor family protein [Bacteroidales bacterium]
MNTNKILLILISISCLLFSLPLRAQNIKSISISGKVKEAGTQTPISYATIAVIDQDGKTSGTVTTEDGSFEFTTTVGDKKIVISCVGYVKYTAERIIMESVNLGDVLLQPDAKLLDEVVVKGSKPIVRREIDKLVVDAKSISAIASNAIDLLKRTPGLLVSEEGNISVIGKGKLIVLVNGRESHMTEQELTAYLKSMQSQEVERIEVMTTPPSKYSAEGDAGVVNIVERRKLSDYLGGTLTDQHYASKGHANDISGSLKYQKGNLFLYANTSLGLGNRKNKSTQDRKYSGKNWKQTSYMKSSNRYGSGNIGFEWELSKLFSLGGNYSILSFSPDRETQEQVNAIESITNLPYSFLGYDNISRKMLRHNGALYFIKKWDSNKNITFDINYIHFNMGEDEQYHATGDSQFRYNNKFDRSTDLLITKFDVEIPTQKFKIDFGSSYQYTLTENDASYLDNPTLPNQYDRFRYKEQIVSAYADLMFKPFPKIISKVGLRSEVTFMDGNQINNDETTTRRLLHFFPTFFINYTPHRNHVLSFSYGSRITRPTFAILNPFKRLQNQYNSIMGSPNLSPTTSHTLELGYTFNRNLNLNLSYRDTKGIVDIVPTILSDGKILHSYQNASNNQVISFSATYRWSPSDWFNMTLGAYAYHMHGHSDAYEKPVDNSGWSFLVYGVGTAYFNKQKTWIAEMSTQYQSKESYALRTTTPRYYLHAGIKYIALKGKLNIGVQIQNLLRNNTGFTQITPQGYVVTQTDDVYRTLKLSVTYNFGGTIKKKTRPVSEALYNRLGE